MSADARQEEREIGEEHVKFLGESIGGGSRAESPCLDPRKVPYARDTAGNYLLQVTKRFWNAPASI